VRSFANLRLQHSMTTKYGPEVVGGRLAILWNLEPEEGTGSASAATGTAEQAFYPGTVRKFRRSDGKHHVAHDDGDKVWYDLNHQERHQCLQWLSAPPATEPSTSPTKSKKRKPSRVTGSPLPPKVKREAEAASVAPPAFTPDNVCSAQAKQEAVEVPPVTPETVLSAKVKQEPVEGPPVTPETTLSAVVKQEPLEVKSEHAREEHRKFGDRVLLARQASNGMMKLGGGNTTMHMHPVSPDHPRFAEIGDRECIAYNDLWNFDAPKYAGQKTASVGCLGCLPRSGDPDEVFSVFVKRTVNGSVMGWEYCGEYKSNEDSLVVGQRANRAPPASKRFILKDILGSLEKPDGCWHSRIERRRSKIVEDEELLEEAVALGFQPDIPAKDLAKILVNLDWFYEFRVIEFVEYDEAIYNYVKEGMTTKDKNNKARKVSGLPCAKASDWYAICDAKFSG